MAQQHPGSEISVFQAGQSAGDGRASADCRKTQLNTSAGESDLIQFESDLAAELAERIRTIPMVLKTSNSRKLAEFRRFGLALTAQSGADLAEVAGTPEEVVQYKALAAGPGILVEDTSLDVVGYDAGVNIRWLLDSITAEMQVNPALEPSAVWRVMVAVHFDGIMYMAGAAVPGRLISSPRGEGFSFDCYFVPTGYDQTLGELDLAGKKDEVSARKRAVLNLISGRCQFQHTSDLPPWTGAYQTDT